MAQIYDCPNSFITFTETTFLTQRDCGILRPFCLPIFSNEDLTFQVNYSILGIVGAIDFDLTRVSLTDADGNNPSYISDMVFDNHFVGTGLYNLYFDFSSSDILVDWELGLCYYLTIEIYVTPEEGAPYYLKIGTSKQCMQRIDDTCFTSIVKYWNNESAFGFYYPDYTWQNKIRLPITFRNPQPKNNQQVYVRTDGTRKKLSARLSKQYQGITDMMTEETHQKLVVALSHDNVSFVTDNDYVLECTFEDEYNQDFPKEMQGANTWPADFTVMETPFDEVNNNCV